MSSAGEQRSVKSDSGLLGRTSLGQPFKWQLLKWVGNKQRQAPEIISYFPEKYNIYFEPFLGSGGVLGCLSPKRAVAGDIFEPLMDIWRTLQADKQRLKAWYAERHDLTGRLGQKEAYRQVLASYNRSPNGADFIFLIRACYGGVVRFRKDDGHMSTPCGVHAPMRPPEFNKRVDIWHQRVVNTSFVLGDFERIIETAQKGDLIYCDPPYVESQSILYGAQRFSLSRLFERIAQLKHRGVFVALSLDGTKYSGQKICEIEIPAKLFKRELFINIGRSMLKRFQMDGQSLDGHVVTDRLLLTY